MAERDLPETPQRRSSFVLSILKGAATAPLHRARSSEGGNIRMGSIS